jgi:hypothetical protein
MDGWMYGCNELMNECSIVGLMIDEIWTNARWIVDEIWMNGE